ncbi:MAG TPA: PEP-CTERM sorting domain-containing protein [Thiobacillaceae bacterium]|nr:PEP-CTERM sorting domain-containing protein [Thiobacillaceae bacterium]
MKTLLATISTIAALATCGSAHAALQYELNSTDADGLPDFVLTVPALISADTTFSLSDFDSIVLPANVTVLSVSIIDPLGDPAVNFNNAEGYFGFFWASAFVGPGQYCAGVIGCNDTAAIMTITETARVPEPGSLALLGLGLAGLASLRKRH